VRQHGNNALRFRQRGNARTVRPSVGPHYTRLAMRAATYTFARSTGLAPGVGQLVGKLVYDDDDDDGDT